LIVINDITRLRQLEDVRRDFVANVSHEIKTPVTAIKGSVETLLEGAINDPEDSKRFLGIIVKHAERLNTLVEDVLSLASIEASDAPERLALSEAKLKDVMETAASLCREKADARAIVLEIECDPNAVVKADRSLFEQAIVNLVDNAIKYSGEASKVELKGWTDAQGRHCVSVRDFGAGIAKEHLPRLFERFYRVDKARSRKLGGTGLGLAIVKHIVQSHNGVVGVDSTPGKGSVFTITLPA
jgi:two-component system phosphate regulon sensor histidine kinase PhoR